MFRIDDAFQQVEALQGADLILLQEMEPGGARHLAEELGMDPFELRRINALRVGATTATGQVLTESTGLLDFLD